MNKRLIIFTVLSLTWCLILGIYVYVQIQSMEPIVLPAVSPAAVILSQNNRSAPTPAPVTILAFGDMMLDRKVREKINQNGRTYPFALIKDFLQGNGSSTNDVVMANAEGPFTYNKSLTLGVKDAPLAFTFDPAMLPMLKDLGFTLLGQANNHVLNFGMAGYRQSTSSIESAGLGWFGDPRNQEVKPYVVDVRGEKVAFIGYHQFANQGLDNVLQAIREAKKVATFIVVYAHWGDEYKLNFNAIQQKTAHALVDAGADAVFGAHPHVIEPIEYYNGKPVFYSLGNFIFDQASTGPTAKGLAVKISLLPESATYDLFPISIVNEQASLMTPNDRQAALNSLNVSNGTISLPR